MWIIAGGDLQAPVGHALRERDIHHDLPRLEQTIPESLAQEKILSLEQSIALETDIGFLPRPVALNLPADLTSPA
jgi:hypothetical protein